MHSVYCEAYTSTLPEYNKKSGVLGQTSQDCNLVLEEAVYIAFKGPCDD